LATRPSGVGPSAGRGDTVSKGDFSTVGSIGLGAGNSQGASGDAVSRWPDSGTLGVRGLSASMIASGGLASCVLKSSGSGW
jgi:hypothetical protein